MSDTDLPANATILNPAHSYWRAPPSLAGCWCPDANLLSYFYGIIRDREAHCPAEYMVHFPSAFVVAGQFILGTDRQWFVPSITDYTAAEAVRPGLEQRIGLGGARRMTSAGKPNVMIAKAGASNYGHTLAEILPRLINLWRSPLRDIRLLVPQGMQAFTPTIQSLLDLLGVTAELVFVGEQDLALVENLVFIGPVSLHNTRKSTTLLSLRDLLWRSVATTPQPQRRLYVERPPREQRSLDNAGETRAALEGLGFETVHPALLPFEEQVRLFSQASHVVGTLGAGLTNILFAPPTCRVLMIDPGLADYFFWDLAALAGQPFTWLFTGPVSFYSQELASATYPVDLDGLRYALKQGS